MEETININEIFDKFAFNDNLDRKNKKGCACCGGKIVLSGTPTLVMYIQEDGHLKFSVPKTQGVEEDGTYYSDILINYCPICGKMLGC